MERYEVEENGYMYIVEEENGEQVAKYLKSEQMEAPVNEPTERELFQAEVLLSQAEILANQEAQDEVLAALLLNGLEVPSNV